MLLGPPLQQRRPAHGRLHDDCSMGGILQFAGSGKCRAEWRLDCLIFKWGQQQPCSFSPLEGATPMRPQGA